MTDLASLSLLLVDLWISVLSQLCHDTSSSRCKYELVGVSRSVTRVYVVYVRINKKGSDAMWTRVMM